MAISSSMETSRLSRSSGGPWPSNHPSIHEQLKSSLASYPDKVALTCMHQPADLYGFSSPSTQSGEAPRNYLRWTYSQLDHASDLLARHLEKNGVRKGMSLCTVLPNGVEFVVAFWTAHKMGCTFVPLHHRTLNNPEETAHMFRVGRVAALIVENKSLASVCDQLAEASVSIKVKISVQEDTTGPAWQTFRSIMEQKPVKSINGNGKPAHADVPQAAKAELEAPVAILFTSGTTSMPKGCPHTNETLTAFFSNLARGGTSPNETFCGVLPNNHAMGYFYVLYFLTHGAAIVYPSAEFQAPQMLAALDAEKCTHTCLVPTALLALLDAKDAAAATESTERSVYLRDVCLAGASITPTNMRQVIYELGSRGVSTGFGMTEGSPIWTGFVTDPEDLVRRDGDLERTLAGSASPGVQVKICEPDGVQEVARGIIGEVHQAGPGLIEAYLDANGVRTGSKDFYTDKEGVRWFITGDQGIMYPDGKVSMTGRYKDMIIRGGENIAPAAIEHVLGKFAHLYAQVVGIPSEIAGEVPIVVVSDLGTTTVKDVQDTVREKMGVACVPDGVVTLSTLGLSDFPKTTSGKIQKVKLREVVVRHYQQQQQSSQDSNTWTDSATNSQGQNQSGASRVETVFRLCWSKATGIAPKDLEMGVPSLNLADSVTTMRVRGLLRRELGFTLSAEDMAPTKTLTTQLQALHKVSHKAQQAVIEPVVTSGPQNFAEVFGSPSAASEMVAKIETTLSQKGFDWKTDVQAVFPAQDYLSVLNKHHVIDTWNFAIAVMTSGASVQELDTALRRTLANHSMLTSCVVTDKSEKSFFVNLKPTPKLFATCLKDHGKIASVAELEKLSLNYPYTGIQAMPGPLFHAMIMYVEETQSAAFIMQPHHIVHDITYLRMFLEDLDHALRKPTQAIRPRTSYQLWAEMHEATRMSPTATADVNWHVERLADLHIHGQHIYPAAKVPRKAVTGELDGYDCAFSAPGLRDLKQAHSHISAAAVLKTAVALVNVNRTKHTHAVLANFEAGRTSFPNLPSSLQAALPGHLQDASDVAGPTMQGVTSVVHVDPQARVLALLEGVQAEQTELTRRCHAPVSRIMEALNAAHPGAGDLIPEIQGGHFLDWVPGFLGEYDAIKVMKLALRAELGLVTVASLAADGVTFVVSAKYDEANYSMEETVKFVADVQAMILALVDVQNWDKRVAEIQALSR